MREDSKLEVCRGNAVKLYSKHKLLPAEANITNFMCMYVLIKSVCAFLLS